MKARLAVVGSVTWFTVQTAAGAISVGAFPGGYSTFDTQPFATEWAAGSIAGGNSTFLTSAALDASIQAISAFDLTNRIPASASVPPSTGVTARWNSTGQLLQTRPDGVGALLMMATLQNDAGVNLTSLYISYDFTMGPDTIPEEIPGYRVYYSFTGQPGAWTVIPEISGLTTSDRHGMPIVFSTPWPAGTRLYLLWADDNFTAGTEPYGTIDNFHAGNYICDSFYWVQPFSDLTVVEGQRARFSINLCPHERFAFQWFKDGAAIPGANSNTLEIARTQISDQGTYYATLDGMMQSRHATLTVLPDDEPPRALIAWQREDSDPLTDLVVVQFSERMDTSRAAAALANSWLEGGSNGFAFVFNVFTAEETNLVLEVDPLEPGVRYTLTLSNLIDQASSTNLITPNPTVLEVKRLQSLIPANHVWKYLEAPPETNYLAWTNPDFDDSAWQSGLGAFGFPLDEVLPAPHAVQTIIRCASCGGPNTTWFRTLFALTAEETNAIVQLRGVFDDGAVVYLNGREVWRVRLRPGAITTSTFATNSMEPHRLEGPVEIYVPGLLREALNALAVEVHQSSLANADAFMGLTAELSRGIPRPKLTIEPSGGNAVTVRWHGAGVLQISSVLGGPPGSWQDVLTPTNSLFITNSIGGTLFFRLRE